MLSRSRVNGWTFYWTLVHVGLGVVPGDVVGRRPAPGSPGVSACVCHGAESRNLGRIDLAYLAYCRSVGVAYSTTFDQTNLWRSESRLGNHQSAISTRVSSLSSVECLKIQVSVAARRHTARLRVAAWPRPRQAGRAHLCAGEVLRRAKEVALRDAPAGSIRDGHAPAPGAAIPFASTCRQSSSRHVLLRHMSIRSGRRL